MIKSLKLWISEVLGYPIEFSQDIAPGEYQARMAHEILQDYYLNGAIVYIDDTVIYGSTVEIS